MQTLQHSKIKGIAIWFYIIAAFQLVAAFMAWSSGSGDSRLAATAMVLAGLDLLIGVLFVAFGYYAAKRRPWAFVAGLVLYAARTLLQFTQLFNPIALLIRAFLMFRIWQGLQACLAVNRADQATALLNRRRLEMPQIATESASPVAPAHAWVPSRAPEPQPSTPD
jgi:hypothetical protein